MSGMPSQLEKLVVRHRQVAPMLSALLAGTDATLTLRDPDGSVVLERDGHDGGAVAGVFPIIADGQTIGTAEGGPLARTIATVVSYAVSRELDKIALAREALERYRELNLIYELAETLGSELEVRAIAASAAAEADRSPGGGRGFVLVLDPSTGALRAPEGLDAPIVEAAAGRGIIGALADGGVAEIVNGPAGDDRSTPDERRFGALVCAPMRAHGRLVGVLGAASADPIEYRAADLKVIEAIAALAAPAIDNAMVHATAVEAASERRTPRG
jgi:hypothetical protein